MLKVGGVNCIRGLGLKQEQGVTDRTGVREDACTGEGRSPWATSARIKKMQQTIGRVYGRMSLPIIFFFLNEQELRPELQNVVWSFGDSQEACKHLGNCPVTHQNVSLMLTLTKAGAID